MSSALTLHTTQKGKVGDLQCLGSVQQIGQVEIGDIVADQHVGVDFLDKLAPFQKKVTLVLELKNLRADDMRASIESENVADKWPLLA